MKPASDLAWPQGFVVYDDRDLMARETVIELMTFRIRREFTELNRAIRFFQIETPMLTPLAALKGHEETGFELVDAHFKKHGAQSMYLRPETTFGTYAAFRAMWPIEAERKKQMPICLWQFGKSFRDEQARPMSELRFREFYQLEYQLFFSPDTKADYFAAACRATTQAVGSVAGEDQWEVSYVDPKELAHYSLRTADIYVRTSESEPRGPEDIKKHEVAAISERKDFDANTKVIEISVGLDRLTALQRLV